MKLEELDLTPEMQAIAQDVSDRFGDVVYFTDGRRTPALQAERMAVNVLRHGRQWLVGTYLDSPIKRALMRWLDTHPLASSIGEMRAGFLSVLDLCALDELRRTFPHVGGEAFDLSPRRGVKGDELKAHMKQRTDIKFLDHEAGVEIWHAQRRLVV